MCCEEEKKRGTGEGGQDICYIYPFILPFTTSPFVVAWKSRVANRTKRMV